MDSSSVGQMIGRLKQGQRLGIDMKRGSFITYEKTYYFPKKYIPRRNGSGFLKNKQNLSQLVFLLVLKWKLNN